MSEEKKYPFVYFGHGSAYAKGDFYMVVWFREPVATDSQGEVLSLAPAPLNEAKWRGNYLELDIGGEGGDAYGATVKEALAGKRVSGRNRKPTVTEWQTFEDRINAWLMEVHRSHPIAFVVKSSESDGPHVLSDWHQWSDAQYSSEVVPLIANRRNCPARDQIRAVFLSSKLTDDDYRAMQLASVDEYMQDDVLAMRDKDYNPGPTAMASMHSALGKGKARVERLFSCHPFTQLVYFAWHGAYYQGQGLTELVSTEGWEERLKGIVRALCASSYEEASLRLVEVICSNLPERFSPKRLLSEFCLKSRGTDTAKPASTDAGAVRSEPTAFEAYPTTLLKSALENLSWGEFNEGNLAQVLDTLRTLEGATEVEAQVAPAATRLYFDWWVGRLRGLAFRAVSPGLEQAQRELLRQLLRDWLKTPLGRPEQHVRILYLSFTAAADVIQSEIDGKPCPALSFVASVCDESGESRFFFNHPTGYTSVEPVRYTAIELSNDGRFRLPPMARLHHSREIDLSLERAWVTRFLELAESRGPLALERPTIEALVARTGLTPSEASVLWAGLVPARSSKGPSPLGLSESEAEFADREWNAWLRVHDSYPAEWQRTFDRPMALLNACAPEDPADFWGDPLASGLVDRVAQGFSAHVGRRYESFDEAALSKLQKRLAQTSVSRLGIILSELGKAEQLETGSPEIFPVRGHESLLLVKPQHCGVPLMSCVLVPYGRIAAWAFFELPVGNTFRSRVGESLLRLGQLLADHSLILKVNYRHNPETDELNLLLSDLGMTFDTESRADSADITITYRGSGSDVEIFYRPALTTPERLLRLQSDIYEQFYPEFHAAEFLRGAGQSLAARISKTPVPDGGYEANPQLSVPELVATVSVALGLSAYAASLYLALLVLPNPSNDNLARYFSAKPAAIKKAGAELLTKGLVVSEKRGKAGRDLFLPGTYREGTSDLPLMEDWKKPFYNVDHQNQITSYLGKDLPTVPIHELFERAWSRITSGDAPKG